MTDKQRQDANRKMADKTLKLVIKRLNKEKRDNRRPKPILSIFKIIDHYECRDCGRVITNEEFTQAKFNYKCAGIGYKTTRYECASYLSDYKPVYKKETK